MGSAHSSMEPASPKHSTPQWHPTQTSHFGFQEKYHIPGVQGTAPPVQSQALRARRDGWCPGWGLDSHHLILLEHRDSSFLLIQTGILGALGFSSLADTNCPCPHFGMDSTLWSHSRPRPGDNTTAQLSLLGCLSLCAFPALEERHRGRGIIWSHNQPLEQALSTRKLPNWCPL